MQMQVIEETWDSLIQPFYFHNIWNPKYGSSLYISEEK